MATSFDSAETTAEIDELTRAFALAPHPEGGFFRESYRAAELLHSRLTVVVDEERSEVLPPLTARAAQALGYVRGELDVQDREPLLVDATSTHMEASR